MPRQEGDEGNDEEQAGEHALKNFMIPRMSQFNHGSARITEAMLFRGQRRVRCVSTRRCR
jgi:hypothetical protein